MKRKASKPHIHANHKRRFLQNGNGGSVSYCIVVRGGEMRKWMESCWQFSKPEKEKKGNTCNKRTHTFFNISYDGFRSFPPYFLHALCVYVSLLLSFLMLLLPWLDEAFETPHCGSFLFFLGILFSSFRLTGFALLRWWERMKHNDAVVVDPLSRQWDR